MFQWEQNKYWIALQDREQEQRLRAAPQKSHHTTVERTSSENQTHPVIALSLVLNTGLERKGSCVWKTATTEVILGFDYEHICKGLWIVLDVLRIQRKVQEIKIINVSARSQSEATKITIRFYHCKLNGITKHLLKQKLNQGAKKVSFWI